MPAVSASPDAVLDRVRKLLALATSPNAHEAAAAAERAQRLIAEHRLEAWLRAADPQTDPIEDARDAPLETAKRLRSWKVVLASALAQANGCVAYTLDRGRESSIVLVGRAADRAAVRELWDWLVRRIEWLSATEGKGRPRDWHDAFRIGAVDTVAARLRRATEAVAAAVEPGTLVTVDAAAAAHQHALDAFVAERLALGRGRRIRVRADGYEAGREGAKGLDLPPEGYSK